MTRQISFFVPGTPATAGSKRGFPIRRKNGTIGVAMTHDCKRAKPWMSHAASIASDHVSEIYRGPVVLTLKFLFARSKSHFRANGELKPGAPMWHVIRPDCTKLQRCIEDALTGIVWKDDSQVVRVSSCKFYGKTEGAHVVIQFLE